MTTSPTKAQPEPVALFVSDLHLQASLPRTVQAFRVFLREYAVKARQLYLMGDLFEYWAGDDDIDAPCNREVVDALRQVSDAGTQVFWIAGNRDFLVGAQFAAAAGLALLPDPYVTDIAGVPLVLAHGDAQCTDDTAYMAFRKQVRDPRWQRDFLALPLAQRKQIIEGMRSESKAASRAKSYDIMDVNEDAIAGLFDTSGVAIMIHGHTHRPAQHDYDSIAGPRVRHVLPDWDCDSEPPRGGWLAIDSAGTIRRYGVDGAELS